MSAEEMAEMAYTLLVDLAYESKQDWFNKRLFLSPNNEAFFSIFQYLLTYADAQKFKEKFKFCIPLNEKRKEGEFRKNLCSYLQDLAKNGELGDDVPPIKMALFTSPGRSAFLHVLLSVIEWVLRKKASSLGIIMPPHNESEEALSAVLDFHIEQLEADRKLAEELRTEMQSQVECLVSDLQKTHESVEAIQEELTRAQEQTKTSLVDEFNLQKFSKAVSTLASIARPLRKLLEIAQSDSPSRDALTITELPSEILLQAVPHLQPMVDELSEQISSGQVDIILYIRLITSILKNRRPLFNDVIEKLSSGSAIDRTLEDRRSCLHRAEENLHRITELIDVKTKSITKAVRAEFEAEEDAVLLSIDPPSMCDLKEFVYLSEADLALIEESSSTTKSCYNPMPPPTQTNLKRKKIGILSMQSSTFMSGNISGISPLATPTLTPRIAKLKNETRRRRSIKEVFTSTPIAKFE